MSDRVSFMGSHRRGASGFTLLEMLLVVAIAGLLVAAVSGTLGSSFQLWEHTGERHALAGEARFAMERMVRAVGRTGRLLLPLAENPNTAWSESVRDVLAVTLDPTLDRDNDGIPDVDNDGDGRVDEDAGGDSQKDLVPGIAGVDDDGDGLVDEGADARDDDENGSAGDDPENGVDDDGDGAVDEDWPGDRNLDAQPGIAGVDDDGDGLIDEGPPADDDEDGANDEDWLDVVVYRVSGGQLFERLPDLNPVDGTDFTERVIADNVTQLRVERLPEVLGQRASLVDLTLELGLPSGETVSLHTRIRVGEGL